MQNFIDEFEISEEIGTPVTLAMAGEQLHKRQLKEQIKSAEQKTYRSGVSKLLYLMKTSQPDVLNAVHELSYYMAGATEKHVKSMYQVMK